MASFTKSLKAGNPTEGDIDIGPIQNLMQFNKVKSFLEDYKTQGYRVAAQTEGLKPSKGYFIQPTIIDNPPDASKIVTEEPFGPMIPVQPWTTVEDVIQRANDTKTGLGACIWSKDIEHAERIARKLEVGSVYINSPLRSDWKVYFSGHKESGLGGERGLKGTLAYCNAQAVHVYKT